MGFCYARIYATFMGSSVRIKTSTTNAPTLPTSATATTSMSQAAQNDLENSNRKVQFVFV
jgi:hypothetical protein